MNPETMTDETWAEYDEMPSVADLANEAYGDMLAAMYDEVDFY